MSLDWEETNAAQGENTQKAKHCSKSQRAMAQHTHTHTLTATLIFAEKGKNRLSTRIVTDWMNARRLF